MTEEPDKNEIFRPGDHVQNFSAYVIFNNTGSYGSYYHHYFPGRCFFGGMILGVIWSVCYLLLIKKCVAEKLSRAVFVNAHFLMTMGAACELIFYHFLMVAPMMESSMEMLVFSIAMCLIGIIGLHLICPFRQLVRKSKLRIPCSQTPGCLEHLVFLAISIGFSYFYKHCFSIHIPFSFHPRTLCFVAAIFYGYLALDGVRLLSIAVKTHRLDIVEECKVIGEYVWKDGEWVEFVGEPTNVECTGVKVDEFM
uniref:Uncharacterized protein n=2 Tax=Caenorhabditis japonica TaxID=281687 RepID=A0A8R1HVS6_CAEJA